MENHSRRILVADDDPSIRALLKELLEGEHYNVYEAKDGEEVVAEVSATNPDLVLMDIRMPKVDGLAVLQQMQAEKKDIPMILMTAFGSSNLAIQAIRLGAYDYITKPFDLDDLLLTIRRFFERQELTHEIKVLRQQMQRDPSERIIGQSPVMQEIYKTIGRVAGSDATVLISGETGTGKELVAETIHYNSTFSRGPLIKVNCAALPETLLESELFGHEKGAFTGAIIQRKGRFELAHKGSIFLDEVGELSLGTQKKLLRVLQEREFERVGGSTPIKVDVRVISATNKILEDEVGNGKFREDLFYRLNVISINLPPLRDRKDDISPLVEHFLHKHRYSPDSPPSRISEEALKALYQHDWPGNVRELENVIERAVVMSQGRTITSDHLLFSPLTERRVIDVSRMLRERMTLKDVLSTVERQLIVEALDQAHGNRSEAAQRLGVYRRLLYAKMKEHGLMN